MAEFRKVSFDQIENFALRTDQAFQSQEQKGHHNASSPFRQLPIDMVKSFPLDYMHSVCLGVMRKLLLTWTRGAHEFRRHKLSASQISEVSLRLLDCKKYIPKCFARKPRRLDEIERWKATELRQFLLYTGCFVLKDILHERQYTHFLSLNIAMSILVSDNLAREEENIQHAENLLRFFDYEAKDIYGPSFLVYNVHCLLHLGDDARNYGSLDNCSAFCFENYLQCLKRLARRGKNPLVQIVKRLDEKSSHLGGAEVTKSRLRPLNQWFMLGPDSCCNVQDLAGDGLFLCATFCHLTDCIVNNAIALSKIGWYKGRKNQSSMKVLPLSSLTMPAIYFEADCGTFMIMSILHQL